MHVVVAPDKFAGTLTAAQAAAALAAGWTDARPADEVCAVPMADGGVGTLAVLEAVVDGAVRHDLEVVGPLGRAVGAAWLALPDGTGVVEVAEACGLHLLEVAQRDPLRATTYGVGQLLRAAVEGGSRRLVVALGGSATVDGGAGMLTALGHRLRRADGNGVKVGGRWLGELAALTAGPALDVELVIASDVTSPLLGPQGAAAVFGPQKGADAGGVRLLEANLAVLADVLVRDLDLDAGLPEAAGAGAAGGLGFALLALGGRMAPGAQVVAELVGLDAALASTDVVVTGEGALDAQSAAGKAPWYVRQQGRAHGAAVLAVVGRITDGADRGYDRAVALGPEGMERAAELVRQRACELARGMGVDMTEQSAFKASTQRVLDAAREAGLDVSVRTFPEGTRTAEDAARAIGCPVAAIVKSLVFQDDDGPVLVLVSGANQADLTRIASVLDAGEVRRADATAVRDATGFAIGGVAPLGLSTPLRILMDADLLELEQAWAAAGTPDTVFAVAPSALRDATEATVVRLAEVTQTGPEVPPRTEADRLTSPGER